VVPVILCNKPEPQMTRFRLMSFSMLAVLSLSACSTELFEQDSDDGVFIIEHTGPGTVYWK